MQDMKRWHKRTACILVLGVLGVSALAYRPALIEDSAGKSKHAMATPATFLTEHDDAQGINLHYTWDLGNHPVGTMLTGDLQPDAFSLLQPARWEIDIYTEHGELKANYTTPVLKAKDTTCAVQTEYGVYFGIPTLHYLPNGNMVAEHPLHLVCHVCITPPFWQKPICTTAGQILLLNPTLGSVDTEEPLSLSKSQKIITEGPTADIPARYYGTEREKAVQYLLYEFADAAYHADLDRLRNFFHRAEQYTGQHTTADKEWPACWEEAAAQAERAAQLVEVTLTHLQENNCYDLQELADFINGPVFARIFGNQLKKREKIDFGSDFGTGLENLEFEIITEE